MKELESNRSVTLLNRTGRSFTVTPTGKYFYQYAKQIVAELDQLIDDTRQLEKQSQEEYVLHLGYLMYFGTSEFLHAVAAFAKKFPQVKVNIKSGTHNELFDLLRNDKLDLNFSDQWRALSSEYRNQLLAGTNLMAVVPKDQFENRDSITTKDLADLPCILIVGDTNGEQEADYAKNALGIKSQFITATNDDDAQMKVAAGQGFAVVNNRTQNQVNQQINRVLPLYNGQHLLHQKYYA